MFTKEEYQRMHDLVFTDTYPGYTKNVVESPNGNGVWDCEKKYAHIALKYLGRWRNDSDDWCFLWNCLTHGLLTARKVAINIGVPNLYLPTIDDSTLRIISYPPGSVTHPHCDFDLFTLMLYRDHEECFRYLENKPNDCDLSLNKQLHYGELIQLIDPRRKASYHEVVASDQWQHSIVFFAMPNPLALLPNHQTVEEWVADRKARSRKVM